jgi:hypothetical protein
MHTDRLLQFLPFMLPALRPLVLLRPLVVLWELSPLPLLLLAMRMMLMMALLLLLMLMMMMMMLVGSQPASVRWTFAAQAALIDNVFDLISYDASAEEAQADGGGAGGGGGAATHSGSSKHSGGEQHVPLQQFIFIVKKWMSFRQHYTVQVRGGWVVGRPRVGGDVALTAEAVGCRVRPQPPPHARPPPPRPPFPFTPLTLRPAAPIEYFRSWPSPCSSSAATARRRSLRAWWRTGCGTSALHNNVLIGFLMC